MLVGCRVVQEPRWWKTTRPYTAADVVAKRGTLRISYPSDVQGKKLWRILSERFENGTPSHTYGAQVFIFNASETLSSLRAAALTRCRLRLCRADADQWAAVDPQSWKALVKGRHYEELAVEPRRILEDGLGCFPWPLPSFEELLNYS